MPGTAASVRPSALATHALSGALVALRAAAAVAVLAASAAAAPIKFPATPDGAREVRDERDVSPYLAAWKASNLGRARALATPATANQTAYDVHHYDLDLTFTPTAQSVAGTVKVRASVLAGPLAEIELDLAANMVVDAATAAGAPAAFARSGDRVTVQLDRAYQTGEIAEVGVTYHGIPSGGSLVFTTYYGRRLVWSLSEPYGARTWWPCKDQPADKADSVDLRFTVPTGLIAASNGTRTEATDNGTVAVSRWRHRYPITTYLVSIAAYPYAVSTDWYLPAAGGPMPIDFYNVPESLAGANVVQPKVKDMLAAFAARFGEYPFLAEKYGHAEFTFGGGMEHQTCTSLGAYIEYIVAHEAAHQWWGDWVTCRDFHHIWINEGLATWSEALWAEATGGAAAYRNDLAFNRYFGPGTIHVPDAADEARIFSSNLSYNKGSWVPHMLRGMLGDSLFFGALRAFGQQFAYGTATTEDVRDAFEAHTGWDLDAFFQQWIYGERYPAYRATWTSAPAPGGHDVTLTLVQTQSGQLFTMPVPVRVTTASGETTFVVRDSLRAQTFVLRVPDEPRAVAVDPDQWILRTVETPVTSPSFDRPVLLVNGVDWATYGAEITNAYANRAFWGDYAVDFWDCFAAPAGGYPASLPAPLGHGAVPPEVMGRYRNVVWVGNHLGGDLDAWQSSPILSYLEKGGNVLLMSRMGDQFLPDTLLRFLGVSIVPGTTLYDCVAARPGLTNIARTGTQSACIVLDTARTQPETQLLWRAEQNYAPHRGIGFFRAPAGGGTQRAQGGRFAFLSGRPYRWDHAQLRANVMTLLDDWFLEPLDLAGAGAPGRALALAFGAPQPNPSAGEVALHFTLPRAGVARLELLDVAGRRVRTLRDGWSGAGTHEARWDGRDAAGRDAPAGLYWARLALDGEVRVQRIVRVR